MVVHENTIRDSIIDNRKTSFVEKWKVESSCYLYQHKYLTVRKDSVITQTGVEIPDFFVIENPNWVNVIAITEDGLFIIEQQYRHGIKQIGFEICAGMVDEGEQPLLAAQRELLEETGYSGGEWELFMVSSPNPSSMNNINYTFLARGVSKSHNSKPEKTESIKVFLMTSDDVKKLLFGNKIIEGIMQAPLWKYFATIGK